jgi:hypothetical protein
MTDLDTTTHDGRACYICGEDATGIDTIEGREFATCNACHDDEVATCAHCESKLWQAYGRRLPGRGRDLFHQGCAAALDAIDSNLGDFEQTRR